MPEVTPTNLRFYVIWKRDDDATIYHLATQLQALSGVFSAACDRDSLDGHRIYLHLLSGHRVPSTLMPSVLKLSKASPLQILAEIPPAWISAGALPAFVVLFQMAVGRSLELWKQLNEVRKGQLEIEKLKLEVRQLEERLRLPESDFRKHQVEGYLGQVEDAGFCDWNELPPIGGA